ncbi:MAG: hypothetical protein KGI05_00350 [Thaumarchaeota archaeon]|nr:hypothetical protein [Nitrososphaerota archaeon]
MNSGLRPKFRAAISCNKRQPDSSYAAKIIQSLYPENKKTFSDLTKEFGTNARYALSCLKRRGLIKSSEATYGLTDLGIWFAISNQLDIPFLELCLLACACCVQERFNSNGAKGVYPTYYFEEIFKKYYSKQRLTQVCSNIRTAGFGYKASKKTLIIHPKVHEKLIHKYGAYFKKLEAWLDDIQERECEIISSVLGD